MTIIIIITILPPSLPSCSLNGRQCTKHVPRKRIVLSLRWDRRWTTAAAATADGSSARCLCPSPGPASRHSAAAGAGPIPGLSAAPDHRQHVRHGWRSAVSHGRCCRRRNERHECVGRRRGSAGLALRCTWDGLQPSADATASEATTSRVSGILSIFSSLSQFPILHTTATNNYLLSTPQLPPTHVRLPATGP